MWVPVAGAVLVMVGGVLLMLLVHARSRHMRIKTGRESIVGRTGVSRTRLSPSGVVFLDGELWDAISTDSEVPPGSPVLVRGVQGLTLIVTPVEVPVDAYYGR